MDESKNHKKKKKSEDEEYSFLSFSSDDSSLSPDEEKCRFCLDPLGEPDSYFRPCKCNSFLHYQCLEAWQKEDGSADQCETCLFTYQRKRKKTYSFAGCDQIWSNPKLFKSLFLILYYLAPYLWRFDARFGFYPGFSHEVFEAKTSIAIQTFIYSIIMCLLLFVYWIPALGYLEVILQIWKDQDIITWFGCFSFSLTKVWQMYALGMIPLFLIGIIHLIGYCVINFWVIPSFPSLKDNDIFHGTSILTFIWGSIFIMGLWEAICFLYILFLGLEIIFNYLKNLCCTISEIEEIKPYKENLDV